MTLQEYLQTNSEQSIMYCCVEFIRYNGRKSIGRFEGIKQGRAVIRYNGRDDRDWYLPFLLDPNEVEVVLKDGQPIKYDARPLTQR